MTSRALLTAISAFYAFAISAKELPNATYHKYGNDQTIVYPLPDDIVTDYDHRLKIEDGVEISMNVYRPKTKDKVPVLMAFTSYGKDMWPGEWMTKTRGNAFRRLGCDLGSMTVSDEAPWEGPDPGYWVPHGYAVIIVDARGTGKSGGKNDPFSRRVHEDFARAVEWASRQPWCTGKVGTTGTSYLGITQWYVNALQPEGLAAMCVWEGLTDHVRDAAFHGGIPETAFVPWWLGGHGEAIDPDSPTQFGMKDLPKVPTMKYFTEFEIPPTEVGKITVPALVISTWSNQGLHSRGGFEGYKRLNTEKYLYTHGAHEWTNSNAFESLDYQRTFFDHYLKGDQSARDKLMKVRLEVRKGDGEFYVREEETWPIEDTKYRKLRLDLFSGTLTDKSLSVDAVTHYNSVDTREKVVFSYTFEEDTEIVGYPKLKLWVSTTAGNDMDLFVGIRKRDPEGRIKQFMNGLSWHNLATRGWLRVSLRKLDEDLATEYQPVLAMDEYQPIKPGEIVPVEIEILPFAVWFEAGSKLELIVKGSDIARESNRQHDKLVNQGYHKLHAGKAQKSHLVIPVIDRGQSSD